MTTHNGKRVMFQQAMAAVIQTYPSPRACRAFEAFKDKYLSGKNTWAVFVRHPVTWMRYFTAEHELMLARSSSRMNAEPFTAAGAMKQSQDVHWSREDALAEAIQAPARNTGIAVTMGGTVAGVSAAVASGEVWPIIAGSGLGTLFGIVSYYTVLLYMESRVEYSQFPSPSPSSSEKPK